MTKTCTSSPKLHEHDDEKLVLAALARVGAALAVDSFWSLE